MSSRRIQRRALAVQQSRRHEVNLFDSTWGAIPEIQETENEKGAAGGTRRAACLED
jgi:hypothetical protein